MPNQTTALLNIDLQALSEPASKLIETVGEIFITSPGRVKRLAKAKVATKKIEIEGNIELLNLIERTDARINARELERQINIENLVKNAIGLLPDKVSEKPVDKDWTAQFFNYAQDVSDETVQRMWSQVLAGEVENPGTFSRRTLNFLQVLSSEDAQTITKAFNYVWFIDNKMFIPNSSKINSFFEENGLTQSELTYLDSIGLIIIGSSFDLSTQANLFSTCYFDKEHHWHAIGLEKMKAHICNPIAKEIFLLCDSKPDNLFHKLSIEYFKKIGASLLSDDEFTIRKKNILISLSYQNQK